MLTYKKRAAAAVGVAAAITSVGLINAGGPASALINNGCSGTTYWVMGSSSSGTTYLFQSDSRTCRGSGNGEWWRWTFHTP